MLITVECSKILTVIIMAFDKFSTEQWVGTFKGDQWCFTGRQNKGKQQGKAPSRCRDGRLEPVRLSHWRRAHLEKGLPVSRPRRQKRETDKWREGGMDVLKNCPNV